MLRTFLSVVAAALLISVILLTPASSADTGEATIPHGDHRSWSVEMDRHFTLSYAIETVDGSNINVLVIPGENYSGYLEGSAFHTVTGAWAENVTNTTMDLELRPGVYYVVVESAGHGGDNGTMITYRIDASAADRPGSSLPVVLGSGALVLLGTVLVLFVDLRLRDKR